MTTENDFQIALNMHPEDWQTRLVFADWLDERGDPRADGYRALGRTRARTVNVNTSGKGLKLWTWFPSGTTNNGVRELPRDWLDVLDGWACLTSKGDTMNPHAYLWRDYRSRRVAEDAAARAFAKLPDARRAELLASGRGS